MSIFTAVLARLVPVDATRYVTRHGAVRRALDEVKAELERPSIRHRFESMQRPFSRRQFLNLVGAAEGRRDVVAHINTLTTQEINP
jgi:hypothetical protein